MVRQPQDMLPTKLPNSVALTVQLPNEGLEGHALAQDRKQAHYKCILIKDYEAADEHSPKYVIVGNSVGKKTEARKTKIISLSGWPSYYSKASAHRGLLENK
jgi:hypothetical protein